MTQERKGMCCTVTAQWAAEWFQIATLNVLWRFSCQFCKKIKGLVLGFHISYCFRATETDCVWVLFWSIHALNGYLLRLVTYPMQKPKLWKRHPGRLSGISIQAGILFWSQSRASNSMDAINL